MRVDRVLVPTDFSPNARAAIEAARSFAERFGAQIDVLHVYEVLPRGLPGWHLMRADGTPVAAQVVLKELASGDLERLLGELRSAGMTVHGRVEEGNPWKVITQIAEQDRYDLIIISTHGRTGVDRFFMGSVTERVVRHAPCPVLVVRPTAR